MVLVGLAIVFTVLEDDKEEDGDQEYRIFEVSKSAENPNFTTGTRVRFANESNCELQTPLKSNRVTQPK